MLETRERQAALQRQEPLTRHPLHGASEGEQTFKVVITTGKVQCRSGRPGRGVRWVDVFLQPEGDRQIHPIGQARITENAHATEGHPLHHYHEAVLEFRVDSSGMIRTSLQQQSKIMSKC